MPTDDRVFADASVVFAYDDDAHFGLLSSGVSLVVGGHARVDAARHDVSYTPTDCFETFAQPELTPAIGNLGGQLNAHRSALMLDRQEGLTKTYNRVHNPDEHADDIVRLREIHVELDHAVRDAYGWSDLDLGHGFHETKFGTRFTFAPSPRQEVLDRLLELNHERYAQEVRQGLHDKAKGKRQGEGRSRRGDDAGVRRCLTRCSQRSPRELRDEVEALMRDDLIGPAAGPEEELRDAPVDRYLLGLLAPRRLPFGSAPASADEDEAGAAFDALPEDDLAAAGAPEDSGEEGAADDRPPAVDQLVPSAFGMTFALDASCDTLEVSAHWGAYTRRTSEEKLDREGKPARVWRRRPCGGSQTIAVNGAGCDQGVRARSGRAGGHGPRAGSRA